MSSVVNEPCQIRFPKNEQTQVEGKLKTAPNNDSKRNYFPITKELWQSTDHFCNGLGILNAVGRIVRYAVLIFASIFTGAADLIFNCGPAAYHNSWIEKARPSSEEVLLQEEVLPQMVAIQSNKMNMATHIRGFEEIEQFKQINGVAIEEIEHRARPGVYADSGFLGVTESFKDVLCQDWRTVEALGTTHIELAARLQTLWNAFNGRLAIVRSNQKLFCALGCAIAAGAGIGVAVVQIPSALWAFLPAAGCLAYSYSCKKEGDQIEEIHKNKTIEGRWTPLSMGYQLNLLAPKEFPEVGKWGSPDLILINTSNGVSLMIAKGVIDYIRKYGFYEGGGERNPYRVDPVKLIAILTGEPLSTVRSRVDWHNCS